MAATIVLPKKHATEKPLILTRFQNGKINPSRSRDIKFKLYQNKSSLRPNRHTLVAETTENTYLGQNFGSDVPDIARYAKYCVGVLDKETGKMKIYPATMFSMRPQRLHEDSMSEEKQDNKETKDMSFIEKNDMLTSAFGSSKRKKAMESRHRNKIEGDALEAAVGSALNQTLSQPDTPEPVTHDVETASVIPPYSKDATKPQDVYKLESIINSTDIEALKTSAQVFSNADKDQIQEWLDKEEYSRYVLNHLPLLPHEERARQHKCCCLMYLSYMMYMYGLRASDIKKKDPFSDKNASPLIKKKLLDNFTVTAGGTRQVRCMPARLRDKLASYILVLCLIIDDFHLVMSDLQKDLKLGQKRLEVYVRALGCRMAKQKVEIVPGDPMTLLVTTLPMPLKFPEQTAKRKKERR